MKLNSLVPDKGSICNSKRRGRGHGSGLGKSAGRGDKGAGQRSGFKRRSWFEGGQMPLSRRLPKRGFTNNFKKEFQIVNISKLDGIEEKKVDAKLMYEKGLVRSPFKPIKILGSGDLKKSVDIVATEFSKSAKEKIEKSGGTAQVL
ncbi:MAG: 50S ribosomal protein L15 [Candidatus Marinimicrobia bacterium]|nr:50S ribosomal protein L15 [Candidatus Neomarinimicrobiota bacterium]|tara:strand:+ start:3922 stop:4359 length:438 start_codon:yes stop_codon:yes gene_type:complete